MIFCERKSWESCVFYLSFYPTGALLHKYTFLALRYAKLVVAKWRKNPPKSGVKNGRFLGQKKAVFEMLKVTIRDAVF